MDNFTIAFCAVIACLIIYMIFIIIVPELEKRRKLFKHASKFSGPPALPIIGNTYLLVGGAEEIWNNIVQLHEKMYPSPYRLWIGNNLLIHIKSPQQLKVVLNSPKTMDKGHWFDFAIPWLGTGLLTASETTMGVNLGSQMNDNNLYAETTEKIENSLWRRMITPWLHPDFIFRRTQIGKNQQKWIKFLHNFTNNVIQMKKKELLEQSNPSGLSETEEGSDTWTPRRKIFLDHIIEATKDGGILSDEELREEVNTIMTAGSDTAAVTMSYVMLMLAPHPEIQEKIHQEVCEIYGVDNDDELHVTPENLARMTYTERVIKETLRIFPIAPFIIRSVTEDLDIGEYVLPSGCLVIPSIIELHRNEDIWPEPLKFDPDRFLPENVKQRDHYSYLAFSGGPRGCIGEKYAMMSLKVLLATIIRRYVIKKDNITPTKDIRLKWECILRPVDPISVRIERRSRNTASV